MAEIKEEQNTDIKDISARTEDFIENNKKNLSIGLGVVLVLVLGYFGWKKFILEPKETEAQSQMFVATRYFEMDSMNLAINGDGNYLGFEAIAADYGMTKAANLAQYYLGVAYLKKGEYEKAIEHLKAFDTDDAMLGPIATGCIGDAYCEMGKLDESAQFYMKASTQDDNSFTSPIYLMKAGSVYQKNGKFQDALSVYEKIKKDYPKSSEAQQIDKYIALAKGSMK